MNLIIFIFNIISLLDLWEFYIVQTNSAPISVCSDPPLMPAVPPTKENALKNQDKINKEIKKNKKNNKQTPSWILHFSSLSNTFSFILANREPRCDTQ